MDSLIHPEILKMIGWTIIHSLWQFLLLFALLKVLLLLINKRRSNLRYMAGLSTMTSCFVFTAVTFQHEYKLNPINPVNLINSQTTILKPIPAPIQSAQATSYINAAPTPTLLNYLDIASPYLTFGWMAGMLFFLLKMLTGNVYLYRLRKLQSVGYPGINQKLRQLNDKMQLNRLVKLVISESVTEPFTFGHLKPLILLPLSYVANVPADQLEMILAHELAHIKRYDYLVNMAQTTLEALFFFNPFFKYISAATRDEREFCCDDMAARYCGDEKTMAIALANLKIINSSPQLSLAAAPAQSVFHTRINRLIAPAYQSQVPVKTFVLSLLAILLTIACLTKIANKQRDDRFRVAVSNLAKRLSADKPITASIATPLPVLKSPQAAAAIQPPIVQPVSSVVAAADTDTTHRQKPAPEKSLAVVNINAENSTVPAIYYRTDTVEFSASAYIKWANLADNASLDKMIVKMEGFQINPAGQILFQGQQIKGISLDGNVLAALKLPANITVGMVKYVRVCDTHTDPVTLTLDFELKK